MLLIKQKLRNLSGKYIILKIGVLLDIKNRRGARYCQVLMATYGILAEVFPEITFWERDLPTKDKGRNLKLMKLLLSSIDEIFSECSWDKH